MSEPKSKILLGMSGGIDSTAACLMLLEQGYRVVGVTLRTFDDLPADELPPAIAQARELARRIGIEHHVADVRAAFKEKVVRYFVDEYLRGRTPNPCVVCNPQLKFSELLRLAHEQGCSLVATGHYSRLCDVQGFRYVARAADAAKDQSYFLWQLGQETLRRCHFPLAGLTKKEVRAYLHRCGFAAKAVEGESMEVCFIPDDYRSFLRRQLPHLHQQVGPGLFVDAAGHRLGQHQGYPFYTVGQRKGLGIALGEPAYVLRVNAEKNTVVLGDAAQLQTEWMLVEQPRWVDAEALCNIAQLRVQIRYRSRPVPCEPPRPVAADRWLVHLLSPVQAVAPGQSAVFYDGDRVVGGAFIASQRGLGQWTNER